MTKFLPIDNIDIIKKYVSRSEIAACEISVGNIFLYGEDFGIKAYEKNDTLILSETSENGEKFFYYPIGDNVENALKDIEECAKNSKIPLIFCYLDLKTAEKLEKRYKKKEIYFDRNHSDYIYLAENFKTFSGKKLSGQRNHINRFKREHSNAVFRPIKQSDIERIKEFLKEYDSQNAEKKYEYGEMEKSFIKYLDDYEVGLALNTLEKFFWNF